MSDMRKKEIAAQENFFYPIIHSADIYKNLPCARHCLGSRNGIK